MQEMNFGGVAEADGARGGMTFWHAFGEITFLLSQSDRHDWVLLSELPALILEPVKLKQFHIFREGGAPIGAALWAWVGEIEQQKLRRGIAHPENRLALGEWTSGRNLWLIDLIAPFATKQNRQLELMIADLAVGPFSGKAFSVAPHLAGEPSIMMGPAFGSSIVKKIKDRLRN